MTSANINVRVDAELKKSAEELFADLGFNMSTAITMFLKSAVSNDGIPFAVRRNAPNRTTRVALDEFYNMKRQPEKYKSYDSFDDMIDDVIDEVAEDVTDYTV
ncbi:type II toxin-antitoxin system RelB/DinJ family antitoxin [Eubacterium sp.]|uniref:type II toxin-antitoxin system RelB/DinJ family antitoxin n=1 Tax=Eubacterium sp. TaxID=142586 RepID=UPI0025CC0CD9|nr:type II toxin-antitoxin system RelB/DinJ family antitoxin [Eubacterium sp.]MCR5628428.1 type II toxin-antitoxin system RelB/DinJ family antitoxin [Eubacterium sp.]